VKEPAKQQEQESQTASTLPRGWHLQVSYISSASFDISFRVIAGPERVVASWRPRAGTLGRHFPIRKLFPSKR